MKKVIHKWFWVWQFEDEEKWLNQMAADGWALCDVGFCRYTFEPCQPQEYMFKIELLSNSVSNAESVKYIKFIEDTGAEYVSNYMRWVYFRQKSELGRFEIVSTRATRIKLFERVCGLLSGLAILNLISGIINIILLFVSLSQFRMGNLIGLVNLVLAAVLYYNYRIMNRHVARLVEEKRVFED